jgi:hypothetical protein
LKNERLPANHKQTHENKSIPTEHNVIRLFKMIRGLAANLLPGGIDLEERKLVMVLPNMPGATRNSGLWHKTTYKQAKNRYTAIRNSEATFFTGFVILYTVVENS